MITPEKLISVARGYIETPFAHQGRLPGIALDCAGLIICAAIDSGLNANDVKGYSSEPDGRSLQSTEWKPGDLLLMKFYRDPRHVALWTGETIIHANNVDKKVIEQHIDKRIRHQVVAAYRFMEFC